LKINSTRERLLASSMICGAALFATQAFAAENTTEVTEIVVTGSRIPTPNLTSVSPVTAIGSAEIKAQGVTRVEDMINSLPQAFAAQGGSISNGSNGTATVNLRNLGASRTLVLIDGRRLGPGNPSQATAAVADLNFIPSSLVERVDVLTGGASAVYGADAVAGVVNFIMKKDYEGVRVDAQWSTYQHSQHSDALQAIIKAKAAGANDPSQFALPNSNVRDGDGAEVTLTFGVNSPDGKGNITAYASYRQINQILEGNRDYSTCTLNSGAVFTCGGSGTASPARVGGFTVSGSTFRPRVSATDVYNFGPTNFYQRPDERYTLGAFAHYQIADWAQAYSQVMFMDDRSVAQIAPGGIFAANFNINCDNAFLTTVQQGQLCGANAGSNVTNFRGVVAKRNVEGGGRQSDFRHSSYRYVVGLKGDLSDNWNYDGYMEYTATQFNSAQTAYFQTQRIQNALIARKNAAGQIVCQSVIDGSDPACVPYNIFQEGQVSQAALNYLQVPAYTGGNASERVVNLTFGGNLGAYGVKTPWANDGVGVALGGEYRREHVDFHADFVSSAGLLNGAGGAAPPIDKSFDVYELFGEARIPIAQDQPWAKSLQVELAYRYSDYSFGISTNTYKIGGDWSPIDGYRLRASYQRAVRAPNLVELYATPNHVLDGTTDLCAGAAVGTARNTRCASVFKLTPAQVAAIEPNPANQYYGQTAGNLNLQPELADTYSVGLVATPSFLPGFNFTVDWFDIKIDHYIAPYGADTIMKGCVDRGNDAFCSLIQRDPATNSIWLAPNGPLGHVVDQTKNIGSLHTSGVDFAANYRTSLDTFGLADAGGIALSLSSTWLDKLEVQPVAGSFTTDCAGYYGALCSALVGASQAAGPSPEWRHKFRATWNTPFPLDLALSAQVRYFSEVKLDSTSSQPDLGGTATGGPATDLKLGARTYLDLLATFTVKDNYNFRVGVNNVLDKDPPLNGNLNCPSGPCNGNTWPQVYDALGRYVFVGLTAEF
jgi:outer membrane receptor protein involved in Fe transport